MFAARGTRGAGLFCAGFVENLPDRQVESHVYFLTIASLGLEAQSLFHEKVIFVDFCFKYS